MASDCGRRLCDLLPIILDVLNINQNILCHKKLWNHHHSNENFYSKETQSMKDLKITAFCTTESVPEHLKPLLAEIEDRDHHPVLRLRISYS